MIRYEDVVVRYPRASRDALAGVGLEARRGRLTAVVGPNGSGKSTLVRALLGRIALAGGRVLVNGQPIADRMLFARRVAVVTQREERAFPLTVEEYVALGRFPHLGGWRGAGNTDRAAVERALERAGVEELQRLAQRHLDSDRMAIVVVGDRAVIEKPLRYLGLPAPIMCNADGDAI